MSDGMSDYWRERRAMEHEESIKMDFYYFMLKILGMKEVYNDNRRPILFVDTKNGKISGKKTRSE